MFEVTDFRRPPDQSRKPGEPKIPTKVLLGDLFSTLKLVWAASPVHSSVIALTSLLQAFAPAATLWVSKLLLDAVAQAVRGELQGSYNALVGLLALQVGIGVVLTLLNAVQGASRELLGDSLQNQISVSILEKASNLEVERFENAETYDALRNAYNEVGFRPITVASQLISFIQALITLLSIGALLSRLGLPILLLVLVAT